MVDTWIVVADGSQCRIFGSDVVLTSLSPVRAWKNTLHQAEHRGHSAKGHDSEHHALESRFAAEVGDAITRAVQSREARDVVLVAPKRFLGELLGALPKSTLAHVTARIAKDWVSSEPHDLAKRLREALADNHDAH